MWVNSSSELESGVADTSAGSLFSIVSVALREADGIGTLYLDNLRLGTNFSDVVTLLPPIILAQPVSQITIEGGAVIQSALASAADLDVTQEELRVTLAPLSSPHRTRAIAALYEELNRTDTIFPGSSLRLRYAIRAGT